MMNPDPEPWAYKYTPSLPAAAVFADVFGLSAIFHLYQCVRARAWYMVPLIVGMIGEVVGYICRIETWSEAPYFKLPAYIIQSITILIAPAFMAATIYMAFGRIMLVVDGESHSPLRQRFLTLIFVGGDFMSLVIQSDGASVLTKKTPNSATVGKWIVTGGLAVQVMFFGVFMFVATLFYSRLRNSLTEKAKLNPDLWRAHLLTLFAASTLIMVRSIFRIVEYIQGNNGYILTHQVFLYVFDGALMAMVVLLMNVEHPSKIIAFLNGTNVAGLLHVYPVEKLGTYSTESMPLRRG